MSKPFCAVDSPYVFDSDDGGGLLCPYFLLTTRPPGYRSAQPPPSSSSRPSPFCGKGVALAVRHSDSILIIRQGRDPNGTVRSVVVQRNVCGVEPAQVQSQADMIARQGESALSSLAHRATGVYWQSVDAGPPQIFLVRDQFGLVPLLYGWDGERLFVSTDMDAMLESSTDAQIDRRQLVAFLHRTKSYSTSTEEFYCGFHRVRPDEIVHLGNEGVVARRYRTKRTSEVRKRGYDDSVTLIRDALDASVSSHQGCGVALSGGLDSMLLAATKERLHGPFDAIYGTSREWPLVDEKSVIENFLRCSPARSIEYVVDEAWPGREVEFFSLMKGMGPWHVGSSYFSLCLFHLARHQLSVDRLATGNASELLFHRSLSDSLKSAKRAGVIQWGGAHLEQFGDSAVPWLRSSARTLFGGTSLWDAAREVRGRYRYQSRPCYVLPGCWTHLSRFDRVGIDPSIETPFDRFLAYLRSWSWEFFVRATHRISVRVGVPRCLPFLTPRLVRESFSAPARHFWRHGHDRAPLRSILEQMKGTDCAWRRKTQTFSPLVLSGIMRLAKSDGLQPERLSGEGLVHTPSFLSAVDTLLKAFANDPDVPISPLAVFRTLSIEKWLQAQ
jgi:hypothetical protein